MECRRRLGYLLKITIFSLGFNVGGAVCPLILLQDVASHAASQVGAPSTLIHPSPVSIFSLQVQHLIQSLLFPSIDRQSIPHYFLKVSYIIIWSSFVAFHFIQSQLSYLTGSFRILLSFFFPLLIINHFIHFFVYAPFTLSQTCLASVLINITREAKEKSHFT